MSRRLTLALRILAIAAIAVALWWFVRAMDFAALGRAFRTAKLWPLVIAAVLNFVCLWIKAVCWRVMLAPRHDVSVLRLFRLTIATFAASAIAPARAGEVLRVWSLKRHDGVPVADTAAVAVAEKLLDGISMVILVSPVPWLLPGLPSWVAAAIGICAGVAVVLLVGLFIAVGRIDRTATEAPASVIRRFVAGMHVLRSPRRLFGTLGLLLLIWTIDLGLVMGVLYAVDVHVPIAAGLLTLFTLNLTIAVPSTPAQVGALEVGALAALDLVNVPHEAALAFALLYHAMQIIPLLAVGLIFELPVVLGRDRDGESPSAEPTNPPASEPVAELPSPHTIRRD